MQGNISDSWACYVSIEIEVPDGENELVLVQDNDKPPPRMWKMPGGCKDVKKGDITPEDTARREALEEIGPIPLVLVGTIYSKSVPSNPPHAWHAFRTRPISIKEAELLQKGVEIENMERFTITEVEIMVAYCLSSPSSAKMPERHWVAMDEYLQARRKEQEEEQPS